MAKELQTSVVAALHETIESGVYTQGISLHDYGVYFQSGDYMNHITTGDFEILCERRANLALLILAAEEELDDYPMEAV